MATRHGRVARVLDSPRAAPAQALQGTVSDTGRDASPVPHALVAATEMVYVPGGAIVMTSRPATADDRVRLPPTVTT